MEENSLFTRTITCCATSNSKKHLSPRHLRRIKRLSNLDFQFLLVKWYSKVFSDALSRRTGERAPSEKNSSGFLQENLKKVIFKMKRVSFIASDTQLVVPLAQEYSNDSEWNNMYENTKPPFTKEGSLRYYKWNNSAAKGNFHRDLLHENHSIPTVEYLKATETCFRTQQD